MDRKGTKVGHIYLTGGLQPRIMVEQAATEWWSGPIADAEKVYQAKKTIEARRV